MNTKEKKIMIELLVKITNYLCEYKGFDFETAFARASELLKE